MCSVQPQGCSVSSSASLGREGGGRPGCGLEMQTCTHGSSPLAPNHCFLLLWLCLSLKMPQALECIGMGELRGALAGQGLWVVPISTARWSIPGWFAMDLSSLRALTELA